MNFQDDEFVDDEDMEEAEPEEDDLEIFSKADFENIKG